jgi:hypothetical protein
MAERIMRNQEAFSIVLELNPSSEGLPAGIEMDQFEVQDSYMKCCVCPFCPTDWPCCFVNRKAAMQHQRIEKMKHHPSKWEAKMPFDEELEWVPCVLTVYEKKMRWVRVEFVESIKVQQLRPMSKSDGFRLKSLFERKRNLLTIHDQPPEGLFEMEGIAATMRYIQDAKELLQRIKNGTLKAR